ncbi:hypothetical protein WH390_13320 [Candidatus Arsenophonus nilaparvatae]|uniref:hypothetical protein n=1 Tax=Candidatus Arsenophonus nilaparvatae TaxID=1247023 RepID=UPI0005098B96|nr:hypothetical protein [Candidatus Arsenophonus nilaparvatae]
MQLAIGDNGNDKPEELLYFAIKAKSLRFDSTYFNINKVDVILFLSHYWLIMIILQILAIILLTLIINIDYTTGNNKINDSKLYFT